MSQNQKRRCSACDENAPKATEMSLLEFQKDHPQWQIVFEDGIDKLRRKFTFNRYTDAIDFTDEIAALADFEDHHPAILLEWGSVTVTWWTHKIGGLHNNDLVMAQLTDSVFEIEQ
ncbi:MAG: 4a-hydroxytetrahydrobiopterin dehydratase [Deltaproteobacteria bacterium]|nr:4a-hydroxytetrahydrobiopterin dehydratase [Deltaproteobacteria bacterium]